MFVVSVGWMRMVKISRSKQNVGFSIRVATIAYSCGGLCVLAVCARWYDISRDGGWDECCCVS